MGGSRNLLTVLWISLERVLAISSKWVQYLLGWGQRVYDRHTEPVGDIELGMEGFLEEVVLELGL